MRRWQRVVCLALGALLSCAAQAKQLAVVTERANPTANLSAEDLAKILSTRTHSWPDGTPITIVLRDPGSIDMQLVLRKVLNMTPERARTLFEGHKREIVVADSDDAVIRFVSSTRGAIGIIDLYSLTKDVNVLRIDGKLPVEQGYLLRGNSQ